MASCLKIRFIKGASIPIETMENKIERNMVTKYRVMEDLYFPR
jgi:hypothetical protein